MGLYAQHFPCLSIVSSAPKDSRIAILLNQPVSSFPSHRTKKWRASITTAGMLYFLPFFGFLEFIYYYIKVAKSFRKKCLIMSKLKFKDLKPWQKWSLPTKFGCEAPVVRQPEQIGVQNHFIDDGVAAVRADPPNNCTLRIQNRDEHANPYSSRRLSSTKFRSSKQLFDIKTSEPIRFPRPNGQTFLKETVDDNIIANITLLGREKSEFRNGNRVDRSSNVNNRLDHILYLDNIPTG